MQRFWVQSFPDPGRRRIKWRPADRVGYETKCARHPASRRRRDKRIQLLTSRRELGTAPLDLATSDTRLSSSAGEVGLVAS